ncbi:hypothetical protein [Ruoffia sp. FAM 26255]|uniref:hypothetical protein n=1 Tax=Ruoffia sp. FAM 26255 TaxID=3259519 RepID=UPI003888D471
MDLVTKENFDKMVEAYEEKTKLFGREIELLKAELEQEVGNKERTEEAGLTTNTYDMLQQITREKKLR